LLIFIATPEGDCNHLILINCGECLLYDHLISEVISEFSIPADLKRIERTFDLILGYTGLLEKSYYHIKWLPLHKGQTINSTTKFYGPFRIIAILVIVVAC
jgi:hypothetical protein